MVRLYRTFSNLIFTVVTRCVGYLYTVSEWFNPLEPPRTFFSAEKERCVEVFDVSSEWFDCTEPSQTSSSKNHSELTQSTHLAFSALMWFEKVRGGSRGLNHSETVYRYPTHLVTTVKMRFGTVEPLRTHVKDLAFSTVLYL